MLYWNAAFPSVLRRPLFLRGVNLRRGFIKLWRSSVDNKFYFTEPFTRWQAWVDLLLLTQHKEYTITIRGISVIIKKGQVAVAEETLAQRWKWSRNKVRRYLAQISAKTIQQTIHQNSLNKTIETTTIFKDKKKCGE